MKQIKWFNLVQTWELLSHLKILHFPISSLIFSQGEKSTAAYIILKGEITFYEERLLSLDPAGKFIEESA